MSESIVRFGGDTTSRELWEGGPKASTGMSRLLNPANRSFSMVAFQQAKPLQDAEINLAQQVQNNLRAEILRKLLTSGMLSMDMTTGITSPRNTVRINNAVAHINGWLLMLDGANRSDNYSDIIFPAAPFNGTREDLAYIEAWFQEVGPTNSPEDDSESVYKNGGIASGTLPNDLLDTVAGDETARRIQLRWNIRVYTDVNFSAHANGVDDSTTVKARGGATADTGYTFGKVSTGLYRAGDGSTSAAATLHCVDGYVYAIPLIRVHRRNQTAYNASDNPSGAPTYGGTAIPSGLYHDVIDASDVTTLYPVAEPYNQDKNNLAAMYEVAMQKATNAQNELQAWKESKVQQGTVTVYNKFVIAGGVINAIAGTRNVKLTKTGTYNAANFSTFWYNGSVMTIADTQDSVAAVPANTTSAPINFYAYMDDDASVKVADAVPDGKLPLYRITVPAGDTAANLNAVTFTDIRRVESHYHNFYNTMPSATVTLKNAMVGSDYSVELEVESAANNKPATVAVKDKRANTFTIVTTNDADDVVVRYTVVQSNA